MAAVSASNSRPVGRFARISFAVFMLALTAMFVLFGLWQLDRLDWKEQLIADANERFSRAPVALPPARDWPTLDVWALNFTPVTVTGTYVDEPPIRVFISLPEPKGEFGGPGHWYLDRFELEGGGSVFINRGFVPQENDGFAPPPTGQLTFNAIVRRPERSGPFTLEAEVTKRLEWVIDPARFAKSWNMGPKPLAPFYLDLPAGEPGRLPQAGETDITFPNKHLGYALTWLGMAIVTPILLFYWLWNTRPSVARGRRAE
jgi:surfeit locus 1 family protein